MPSKCKCGYINKYCENIYIPQWVWTCSIQGPWIALILGVEGPVGHSGGRQPDGQQAARPLSGNPAGARVRAGQRRPAAAEVSSRGANKCGLIWWMLLPVVLRSYFSCVYVVGRMAGFSSWWLGTSWDELILLSGQCRQTSAVILSQQSWAQLVQHNKNRDRKEHLPKHEYQKSHLKKWVRPTESERF